MRHVYHTGMGSFNNFAVLLYLIIYKRLNWQYSIEPHNRNISRLHQYLLICKAMYITVVNSVSFNWHKMLQMGTICWQHMWVRFCEPRLLKQLPLSFCCNHTWIKECNLLHILNIGVAEQTPVVKSTSISWTMNITISFVYVQQLHYHART